MSDPVERQGTPGDLPEAIAALAEMGVHPVGVTMEQQLIALRLSPDEQAAVLKDATRRERIVAMLRAHGFLYVTLALDEMNGAGGADGPA